MTRRSASAVAEIVASWRAPAPSADDERPSVVPAEDWADLIFAAQVLGAVAASLTIEEERQP